MGYIGIAPLWLWLKIKPGGGGGTQVLVQVSTYQGNPYWISGFLSHSPLSWCPIHSAASSAVVFQPLSSLPTGPSRYTPQLRSKAEGFQGVAFSFGACQFDFFTGWSGARCDSDLWLTLGSQSVLAPRRVSFVRVPPLLWLKKATLSVLSSFGRGILKKGSLICWAPSHAQAPAKRVAIRVKCVSHSEARPRFSLRPESPGSSTSIQGTAPPSFQQMEQASKKQK